MKRQLKKSVVYSLYGISFALLIGGVVGLGLATNKIGESEFQYVSKGILDYEEEVKVVNTTPVIARPYTDKEVNVVKSYYDYKAEAENAEMYKIY